MEKIIHYCWFGKKKKSELIEKCILSWRQKMPEWEIKEWNESNFDIEEIAYTREAYSAGKYAFVSDYARLSILMQYGGIYLDTDVEMLKSLESLFESNSGFMGFEFQDTVAPGLVFASDANNDFIMEMMNLYKTIHFINSDGSYNYKTIVEYTTEKLIENGLEPNGKMQKVCGITIFPKEYFAPIDLLTETTNVTDNTYLIHHYAASWKTGRVKVIDQVKSIIKRIVGPKLTMHFINAKASRRQRKSI